MFYLILVVFIFLFHSIAETSTYQNEENMKKVAPVRNAIVLKNMENDTKNIDIMQFYTEHKVINLAGSIGWNENDQCCSFNVTDYSYEDYKNLFVLYDRFGSRENKDNKKQYKNEIKTITNSFYDFLNTQSLRFVQSRLKSQEDKPQFSSINPLLVDFLLFKQISKNPEKFLSYIEKDQFRQPDLYLMNSEKTFMWNQNELIEIRTGNPYSLSELLGNITNSTENLDSIEKIEIDGKEKFAFIFLDKTNRTLSIVFTTPENDLETEIMFYNCQKISNRYIIRDDNQQYFCLFFDTTLKKFIRFAIQEKFTDRDGNTLESTLCRIAHNAIYSVSYHAKNNTIIFDAKHVHGMPQHIFSMSINQSSENTIIVDCILTDKAYIRPLNNICMTVSHGPEEEQLIFRMTNNLFISSTFAGPMNLTLGNNTATIKVGNNLEERRTYIFEPVNQNKKSQHPFLLWRQDPYTHYKVPTLDIINFFIKPTSTYFEYRKLVFACLFIFPIILVGGKLCIEKVKKYYRQV